MIYIDTGAFIARYIERDQYHHEALGIWKTLRGVHLYTSNFILDELLAYTGRITGNNFISDKVRKIYASESFTLLRPDNEIEQQALELFDRYADQSISYTDCISFALMKKVHLKKVFSFDRHFTIAGFELISDVSSG